MRMLNYYRYIVSRNLQNIGGWKTNRKIIVIESDDWGSIRIPSKVAYQKLLEAGIRVNECSYDRFDAIESEMDFDMLFNVLSEFRDVYGNPPVFTANMLMANPDFNKIRDSGYENYYYELFTDTYHNYSRHTNTFSKLKQGLNAGLFFPQFHGREHLNINRWMDALRKGSRETILAFNLNAFGLSTGITNEKRKSYLQAFGLDNIIELDHHKRIVTDGLEIFQKTFGYNSESFIAPNYTWHTDLDQTLSNNGVKYFQGRGYRIIPLPDSYKVIRYSLGMKSKGGQIFLKRNCVFEPSEYHKDWVNSCLNEIKTAFAWNKPAIIQSHRLNYIGSIVSDNRDSNLLLLRGLLRKVTQRWPDVEFLTSTQLGRALLSNG